MQSLKSKTIAFIMMFVVVAAVLTTSIGLYKSNQVMNRIVDEQFGERLASSEKMFKLYINEQFGALTQSVDGQLVDSQGKEIAGRYEYIDELSENLNVVATIFSKEDKDFRRILTTIKDDKGERVIGTLLDNKGKAYDVVSKGETYLGQADVLGKSYMTIYTPLTSNDNKIIGIYFVGVPIDKVESVLHDGWTSILKFVLVAGLCIVLLVAVSSWLLGGYIVNPIIEITKENKRLAQLDFTYPSDDPMEKYKARKDEIGIMVASIQSMRENIASFIRQNTTMADKVAASAQELSSSTSATSASSEEVARAIEEIAKGAGDQAKDTEQTADSVDRLSRLMDEATQLITEMNDAVARIDSEKEQGSVILRALVEKTRLSELKAAEVTRIMQMNNESADQIEQASHMIESISQQTNLLALNASIEAARAGESGRGFAVVADEIRKLAEQSNAFTAEIKDVIQGLKTSSRIAVEAVEDVRHAVHEQTEGVSDTESKFKGISDAINRVNMTIEKLNASSLQMVMHKDTILSLIQNLSALSEEYAASTEEASASVEEQTARVEEINRSGEDLSSIASELKETITKFKI